MGHADPGASTGWINSRSFSHNEAKRPCGGINRLGGGKKIQAGKEKEETKEFSRVHHEPASYPTVPAASRVDFSLGLVVLYSSSSRYYLITAGW